MNASFVEGKVALCSECVERSAMAGPSHVLFLVRHETRARKVGERGSKREAKQTHPGCAGTIAAREADAGLPSDIGPYIWG